MEKISQQCFDEYSKQVNKNKKKSISHEKNNEILKHSNKILSENTTLENKYFFENALEIQDYFNFSFQNADQTEESEQKKFKYFLCCQIMSILKSTCIVNLDHYNDGFINLNELRKKIKMHIDPAEIFLFSNDQESIEIMNQFKNEDIYIKSFLKDVSRTRTYHISNKSFGEFINNRQLENQFGYIFNQYIRIKNKTKAIILNHYKQNMQTIESYFEEMVDVCMDCIKEVYGSINYFLEIYSVLDKMLSGISDSADYKFLINSKNILEKDIEVILNLSNDLQTFYFQLSSNDTNQNKKLNIENDWKSTFNFQDEKFIKYEQSVVNEPEIKNEQLSLKKNNDQNKPPPPNDENKPPPNDENKPPPNDENKPPPNDENKPPPNDENKPPPNDENKPPPNDENKPPPNDENKPPPNDENKPPPNNQNKPPPNNQNKPPPNNQNKPPPNDENKPPPPAMGGILKAGSSKKKTKPKTLNKNNDISLKDFNPTKQDEMNSNTDDLKYVLELCYKDNLGSDFDKEKFVDYLIGNSKFAQFIKSKTLCNNNPVVQMRDNPNKKKFKSDFSITEITGTTNLSSGQILTDKDKDNENFYQEIDYYGIYTDEYKTKKLYFQQIGDYDLLKIFFKLFSGTDNKMNKFIEEYEQGKFEKGTNAIIDKIYVSRNKEFLKVIGERKFFEAYAMSVIEHLWLKKFNRKGINRNNILQKFEDFKKQYKTDNIVKQGKQLDENKNYDIFVEKLNEYLVDKYKKKNKQMKDKQIQLAIQKGKIEQVDLIEKTNSSDDDVFDKQKFIDFLNDNKFCEENQKDDKDKIFDGNAKVFDFLINDHQTRDLFFDQNKFCNQIDQKYKLNPEAKVKETYKKINEKLKEYMNNKKIKLKPEIDEKYEKYFNVFGEAEIVDVPDYSLYKDDAFSKPECLSLRELLADKTKSDEFFGRLGDKASMEAFEKLFMNNCMKTENDPKNKDEWQKRKKYAKVLGKENGKQKFYFDEEIEIK